MRHRIVLVMLLVAGVPRPVAAQDPLFMPRVEPRTAYGASTGSALGIFAGEMLHEVGGHVEHRLAWRTSIRGDVGRAEWPRTGPATRLSVTGVHRLMHRRGRPYSGVGVSLYRGAAVSGAGDAIGVVWLSGSEIDVRDGLSVPIEFRSELGGSGGLSLGFSIGLRRWR